MKEEQDYIRDIAEIRSMMERSSKFLLLSGWAGIMAGIYALAGAYVAYTFFHFAPEEVYATTSDDSVSTLPQVVFLATVVFVLALGTAVFFSFRKASKNGEKLWNPTSRRLLRNMAVPIIAGGLLVVVLIAKGLIGLVAPLTLVFYGLALFNAGNFTLKEVRVLGLVQIALGLISAYLGYGLLFWAVGFGMLHIIYGIYMHYRYER